MSNSRETELPALTEAEEIQRMAACGFTVTEMALTLGFARKEFARQAETPDTEIWTAIQAGKLQSEFLIADKQRQLAEAGNITAVQVFGKLKEDKLIEDTKNRVWFGT